ncbi:TPA: hypothetical protein NG682_005097 [Vibrio parahaemolyticus]|nr:hypothetical protein [Vibrio parahaemolyticus]HCE3706274.1 hypothetical protein [Vibrio parahaemolyticus]
MNINKQKSRKEKLERLKLKHFVEFIYESNSIRTKEQILLGKSRVSNQALTKILIELNLVEKKKDSESDYFPYYRISKQLEELLFNELSNNNDFNRYVKNSTK